VDSVSWVTGYVEPYLDRQKPTLTVFYLIA
jgi:hypothetical protein